MPNSTPSPRHRLNRETFTTSRLLEFCSRKELELQTGHTTDQWPLVVAKELGDNALDACEEAGVQPDVTFIVNTGKEPAITVTDNGPGIAPEAVAAILDFSTRTSSREAYVSPSRGAQGNALKTLVAMPFALADGQDAATTIIESRGIRHEISLAVDAVRQTPVITHDQQEAKSKIGTSVTIRWPVSASSKLAEQQVQFLQFVQGYALLNPHAAFRVEWADGKPIEHPAVDRAWTKWWPSDPTSIHWYDRSRFERLVAAYAHEHGDRTVREFVTEFRGFSGSGKVAEVLRASGLARVTLGNLFDSDGKPDQSIRVLLRTMQERTGPVKPADLGIIGSERFAERFARLGTLPGSFEYKCVKYVEGDGVPAVFEVAFGYRPRYQGGRRLLFSGVNFSTAINNPFRQLGPEGQSLAGC